MSIQKYMNIIKEDLEKVIMQNISDEGSTLYDIKTSIFGKDIQYHEFELLCKCLHEMSERNIVEFNEEQYTWNRK